MRAPARPVTPTPRQEPGRNTACAGPQKALIRRGNPVYNARFAEVSTAAVRARAPFVDLLRTLSTNRRFRSASWHASVK
ncbi:protein of unknown function [Cupriavidus taiwanensis]|uniref:Uncharacterized protein n=1 Tax=Cupriavidus taiwanensis TaxID=164546 RepID=A0A7Z7JC02_9BURK|nr:protein of unknown function [Cupriavidus taiwanensis]SOZ03090.1 hypothetical protein CBM2597_A110154 [Cupriavidus taiwanensis]SOZ06364.1 hypothetical protein CBM2595_A81049 [Cupriavidus taiwanensis]SPC18896.1 hypothetical protein CBM2594_A80335 [Cupriavidus taiwanensis]SPD41346.1 protein of unknown function [Cupriavidus taiwanensis]